MWMMISHPPRKRPNLDESPASTSELSSPLARLEHPQGRDRLAVTSRPASQRPASNTKPVALIPSSATQNAPSIPGRQPLGASGQAELEDLRYLVLSLMQEHVTTGKPLTDGMKHRLRSIGLIMDQMPGNLATQLIKNFGAADASREELANQWRALIEYHIPGTKLTFPKTPSAREIHDEWDAVRQGIKAVFTDGRGYTVQGERIKVVPAVYVASTIDNFLTYPRPQKGLLGSPRNSSQESACSSVPDERTSLSLAIPSPRHDV